MALAESWLSMSDDLVTTQDLPAVYTIGYGSRTVEETIGLLKQHGIECLIDVRTAPYSRFKPEFSKDALESTVSAAGIRYVYLGRELGGRPDDPTCYADGKVDYDLVRKRDFYRRGIEKVRKARDQHTRMCLMCSEGKPESCHRSALIGVTLTDMGISVIHLDEEGVPRTQQEVIARLTEGQGRLFEEFTFTSRKRYHDEEQEVE